MHPPPPGCDEPKKSGLDRVKLARLQTRYITFTLVKWLKLLHHTHAVTKEYRIFCFACAESYAIIQHVQLQFDTIRRSFEAALYTQPLTVVKTHQLRMLKIAPVRLNALA